MNSEIFLRWFKDIFLKHCGVHRPQMLTMDNHSSHLSTALIDLAKENEIILFALPSKTSHILQVLDRMFSQLKSKFSHHAMLASRLKADMFISKNQFTPILQQAYDATFTPSAIKNAFRKTGTYPVNRNEINLKDFIHDYTVIKSNFRPIHFTITNKSHACKIIFIC